MSKTKKKTKNAKALLPLKRVRAPRSPRHRHPRWKFIAPILARIQAARRELDELAAGADLSDSDHLPVIIKGKPRPQAPTWRGSATSPKTTKSKPAPKGDADRIRLPAPKYPNSRCWKCKQLSHPYFSCEELAEWMLETRGVLRRARAGARRAAPSP